MLPITQLVDIPYIFRRLHDLPSELMAARSAIVILALDVKHTQANLVQAQTDALEAHKEEYFGLKNEAQRDLYRAQLYAADPVYSCADTVAILEGNKANADAQLQNLLDELTSLRYTVRLLETMMATNQEERIWEQNKGFMAFPRVMVDADGRQVVLHADGRRDRCACPEDYCPGPKPCDTEGTARPCVPGEVDDEDDPGVPF